ncbi:MAG: recombinase family protein [Alicyclobacillus sp.]|nr:recombinase family protein [Alicyclobacillus sp.]
MTKTVAIYTRTNSTALNKSFGKSFPDQIQQCFARAKELYGETVTVKLYHDECPNAHDATRPALQKVIDDIRNGRIAAVVVTDITRLSRLSEESAAIRKLCDTQGVELVRVADSGVSFS